MSDNENPMFDENNRSESTQEGTNMNGQDEFNQNMYQNEQNDYNQGMNQNMNQNMNNNYQNNYEWSPSEEPDDSKKRKKKKGHGKGIMAAACVVLVGAVGAGTVYLSMQNENKTSETPKVTIATTDNAKTTEKPVEKYTVSASENNKNSGGVVLTDASGVVSNVMPSIVAITSTTRVSSGNYGFAWFFGNQGNDQEYEEQGAGSGIIIGQTDTELLIVTNNHVVEGADSLSIKFIDDESVEANVKGTDSNADLAVVAVSLDKLKEETLGKIKIATLGDSTKLSVGEGVVAIGNALGYGQSVTTGVVSALDREVQSDDGTTTKMIQTDAAINGGNSGGALLNSEGQVVGINAAKYSSNGSSSSASIEGMGFAIPISSATDIINNLMNQKTKTKVDESKQGALGISIGNDISKEESEKFSVPTGAYVAEVQENGAADKAGLKAKSIITAINGSTVTTGAELKEQLQYYAVGDKVTISVAEPSEQGYQKKDIEVTLQKKTQQSSGQSGNGQQGFQFGR